MRLEQPHQIFLLAFLFSALQFSAADQQIGKFSTGCDHWIGLLPSQTNDHVARLIRRQAADGEKESTTPKSAQENAQQAPRLYPDLPRQPNFLPPFNAPPINGYQAGPLVPFGVLMPPTNRLNADQQPAPFGRMPAQPRPMTSAERLQSQSFAHGLGKKLLSMLGIDTDKSEPKADASKDVEQQQGVQPASADDATKALQNRTVLEQLSKGIGSIYGGLSKMYNSTIQEQLNLLQERFKSETANSTNPWHQRMAQQVPAFFKQMAAKVGEAQSQLNRVWRDMSQLNSSQLNQQNNQQRSFFATFDQFLSDPTNGELFNRAFGMSGSQETPDSITQANGTNQPRDLMSRLRDMWNTRVEPELMLIRGQMSRVWRDLINNGALTQETIMRSRLNNVASGKNDSSSDLVDSILKEIDINGSEYSLVEPKNDASTSESASVENAKRAQTDSSVKLSPQMQSRLIEMQSELNRLWMGLTHSLQTALGSVKRAVNPQPQFGVMNGMESGNRQQTEDPAQNEISDKIKDLAKLQRDADLVRDALQQQQREAERQTLGERFRGFFNGVDMRSVNQLPDRIGEQFNRFGNAVGNFWNRLPERWDTFMTNVRHPQGAQTENRMAASSTTASTTTSSPSEK